MRPSRLVARITAVRSARQRSPLITTPARKLELLAQAGIDVTVLEPFDRALAAMSAEAFVHEVLADGLGAVEGGGGDPVGDDDKPVGVGVGQWTQKNCTKHGKHRDT